MAPQCHSARFLNAKEGQLEPFAAAPLRRSNISATKVHVSLWRSKHSTELSLDAKRSEQKLLSNEQDGCNKSTPSTSTKE
eukprot:1129984-Amphidinium_carterae.1